MLRDVFCRNKRTFMYRLAVTIAVGCDRQFCHKSEDNTRVFCAYTFLRLSSCVEIKGGSKVVFTRISCLAILSDCSSLCTYQGYFTTVLHLHVQMIDRLCLQAVHLGFQSGIPDDVSLLSYLFLQEYIIPSMYRQNRQQVAHWATTGCSYGSGVQCGSGSVLPRFGRSPPRWKL